jgi:hypothetical protein
MLTTGAKEPLHTLPAQGDVTQEVFDGAKTSEVGATFAG